MTRLAFLLPALALCLAAAAAPPAAPAQPSDCRASVTKDGGDKVEVRQLAHGLDSRSYPVLVGQGQDAEVVLVPFRELASLTREDPQPAQPSGQLMGLIAFMAQGVDGKARRMYLNGHTTLEGDSDLGRVEIPLARITQVEVSCR
jgi:hypothetical protein